MTFVIDPRVIHESAARGDRWYPYAVRFPIPEADTQAHITARLLILHSMAAPNMTSLESIGAYYRRDDIHDEATFALAMSGQMAQFVAIDVRADCNYKANGFATSVETQDRGSATLASTPWTPEQCEQLAGLAAWENLNPRCQLPLIVPMRWDGAGVGPHRMFAEWSKYVGKTCPGDERVRQIPSIIDRARLIVAWEPIVEAPVVLPPPAPTTPPAAGGDLMMTLFKPIDADAWFYGQVDARGIAHTVEWTGEGGDLAVQRRLGEELAAGCAVNESTSIASFRNCVHLGELPPDGSDGRHQWRDTDFARVIR